MTEQEFAKVLGLCSLKTDPLTYDRAIEWLRLALEKMMPAEEDLDLCRTTVLAWNEYGIVLQDSEGSLYNVFIRDWAGTLDVDRDSKDVLNLLRDVNALDKVVSPIAAAEYLRLREGRSL